MRPHYQDEWLTVYHGDARAVMAEMEPESVHCVVTSPPYWGLRDYGQPGQLGLEPTPEAYVESMVAVFREVRRVLRADGTVWLNLGDSYVGAPVGSFNGGGFTDASARAGTRDLSGVAQSGRMDKTKATGLKPKDLVGIPWRVAFALQADGWYLRSDIIWSKPNPMPESVTDRPTKSHEYLFLLSKSARYYFDADAVREPALYTEHNARYGEAAPVKVNDQRGDFGGGRFVPSGAGRNIRSVWTVATQPYPGAHFATFPPKLIEPCIKAGTSERGVCSTCGAPWVRILNVSPLRERDDSTRDPDKRGARKGMAAVPEKGWETTRETTGWRPSCRHDVTSIEVPAVVLDPFAGSGTTGMVAQSLSRRAVLIDLSMDYLGQLMDRNRDIPLGLGA